MLCFRDKENKNPQRLIKNFVRIAKKHKVKYFAINSNIKYARYFNANAVHLNSKQNKNILGARKLGLFCIISTHNDKEIKQAKRARVSMLTYSPIFPSPNKPSPKGISDFKQKLKKYRYTNFLALGGIVSKEQTRQISQSRAKGFASIRYFVD